MNEHSCTSPRPYLLRAWHEWCTDNGLTPQLVVLVDNTVQVPPTFVQDGHIVLNVSYDATSDLQMGNEYISFKARFGGKPHDILLPVGRVLALFARETNQGMSFEPEEPSASAPSHPSSTAPKAQPGHKRPAPVVQLMPHKHPSDADALDEDEEDAQAQTDPKHAPDENGDDTPPASTKRRPALKRIK